jgi:membrane-bound serine protease (ClpP class)
MMKKVNINLIALLAILYGILTPWVSHAGSTAVVKVSEPFTTTGLKAAEREIDRIMSEGAEAIIFQFSGTGRSFDSHSALGRKITQLARNSDIRTIAFIPAESLGMSMLSVLSCQEICADEFAQLGRLLPLPKPIEAARAIRVDTQRVIHKLEALVETTPHDPLLARAMADEDMILYKIERSGGESKFVDQAGFEAHTQNEQPPWKMTARGPIVGPGKSLMLSGRQAKEHGLATTLAEDADELMNLLSLEPLSTDSADPNAPEIEDAEETEEEEVTSTQFKVEPGEHKAVVIICDEMIDDGLYESIKRRTDEALAQGATYIIYEIDTFGGGLHSAISIWDYFMHTVAPKAHTVAYVPTKAISAGALMSVACNDIIMKKSTLIGDCAPIIMGGTLEGVEREKAESPTRSYFTSAAEANGYPVALCKAMVTMNLKVYQVNNLETGKDEYFEEDELPKDFYKYDMENKKLLVKGDQLLTWHAEKALEHGLTRAVVANREEAFAFLEKRDNITITRPVNVVRTNWSEELVRWLTSPGVAGFLTLIGLLGIYMEMKSPGIGLPGLVGIIAFVILFGSKYLIGMANWWEIMLVVVGLVLIAVEIFVIPGFGVAGIGGILCTLFGLFAMMVGNAPDKLPIPQTDFDMDLLVKNLIGFFVGFAGFLVAAFFVTKYMETIPLFNRLIVKAPPNDPGTPTIMPEPADQSALPLRIGQTGVALTPLRPSGRVKIGGRKFDVVSKGTLIDADAPVKVVEIEGNRIVVVEDRS